MAWDGEHLFIVTYDVSDQKRWRQVFRVMNGYGEWLQLSVFQCRLSRQRLARMRTELNEAIKTGEDHVLLVDVGAAEGGKLRVESLGKSFLAVDRKPIIV